MINMTKRNCNKGDELVVIKDNSITMVTLHNFFINRIGKNDFQKKNFFFLLQRQKAFIP